MLKRFLSWFKKDYAKASAKILSTFDKVKEDLNNLNAGIVKAKAENLVKIVELEAHNVVLDATALKNSKVVRNLEALLGDDEPEAPTPTVTATK